jgi:universal stress protein A
MMEIKTVLCPIDFSALSEKELRLASQLCERFKARMVVQHNINYVPPIYLANAWMYSETHMYPEEEREAEAQKQIKEVFAKLPPAIGFEGKITFGNLEECILHLARELPADLIVMGTHGPSSAQHVSHTDRIVLQAPCPVLTIRDNGSNLLFPDLKAIDEGEPQPALVPMDFSSHSLRALEYALALIEVLPLTLHLLHVEPALALEDLRLLSTKLHFEEKKRQRMEDSLERLKALVPARFQDRAKFEVRTGAVVDEVIAYAQAIQATLILMGAHPKNVLNRLIFGAHSQGVLHQSPCPVWLIPEVRAEGQPWFSVAGATGSE